PNPATGWAISFPLDAAPSPIQILPRSSVRSVTPLPPSNVRLTPPYRSKSLVTRKNVPSGYDLRHNCQGVPGSVWRLVMSVEPSIHAISERTPVPAGPTFTDPSVTVTNIPRWPAAPTVWKPARAITFPSGDH